MGPLAASDRSGNSRMAVISPMAASRSLSRKGRRPSTATLPRLNVSAKSSWLRSLVSTSRSSTKGPCGISHLPHAAMPKPMPPKRTKSIIPSILGLPPWV